MHAYHKLFSFCASKNLGHLHGKRGLSQSAVCLLLGWRANIASLSNANERPNGGKERQCSADLYFLLYFLALIYLFSAVCLLFVSCCQELSRLKHVAELKYHHTHPLLYFSLGELLVG